MNTLMTSPRRDDRVYATRSLSTLGATASEKVVPVLVEALSDEDGQVRYGAAKALINLGKFLTELCKIVIILGFVASRRMA